MKSRRSFLGYLGIAPLRYSRSHRHGKGCTDARARPAMILTGEKGPEVFVAVKPGMTIDPRWANAGTIRALEETLAGHVRVLQSRRAL